MKKTITKGYEAEYGSIENIREKVSHLKSELEETEEDYSDPENIPAEYCSITDPKNHLKNLEKEKGYKSKDRDDALENKIKAAEALKQYKDSIDGDPEANKEKAEQVFKEQKSLLHHWLHIADAFKEQKEKLKSNPMQDVAGRFAQYLSLISNGKVSSEFPEADKLNMNIYSDNKLLDYGKLSEGTKDTVSLAFRLAVLDHLFPDGGGIIVFDDPFTDMDAERTAQSCKLIKECARRHQVIFLTCREEYADMLDGNSVNI